MSGTVKSDHVATSMPPEYYLDDLSPQGTKPRDYHDAYYSWKRGADNSMPTRPPPSPLLDRVYRSCCCGSIGGLIAWILVAILLVAGITALIVKTTLTQSNKVTIPTSTAIAVSSTASTATTTVTQTTSSDSKDIETTVSLVTTSITLTPSTVTTSVTSTAPLTVTTSITPTPPSTATVTSVTTESSETSSILTVSKADSLSSKEVVVERSIQYYVNKILPPPTYAGYPETMYNRYDLSSVLIGMAIDKGVPTNLPESAKISMLATKDHDASSMMSAFNQVSRYCIHPPIPTTYLYYTLVCLKKHPKRTVSNTAISFGTYPEARSTFEGATIPTGLASTNTEKVDATDVEAIQLSLITKNAPCPEQKQSTPTSVPKSALAKQVEKKITTLVTVVA